MSKTSKRSKAAQALVIPQQRYALAEAIDLLKQAASTGFDESVDMAVRLGVDPRKADQMIRGSCELPHGTGKVVRVLVIAKGEKLAEAQQGEADHYGGEEMIQKIQGGWLEFDRVVATPDMMAQVGKVGKILGSRGLMPNPKMGTVTFDVEKTVRRIKAGEVAFRVDKTGIVHVPVGRKSFDKTQLETNVMVLMNTLKRMRPAAAKGIYLKSITLTSTMGPGIALDPLAF